MTPILDTPITVDTIVFGISLPARWATGINRAADLLRQRHPKADDAEIMRMMLIHGMVAVIDSENNCRWMRNDDDDTLCAIAEAVL